MKSAFVISLLLALFCLALGLSSCSYVDQVVDTRGATVTAPDGDGDGIPDQLEVPSSQVQPRLNDKGMDQLNEGITQIIIQATK